MVTLQLNEKEQRALAELLAAELVDVHDQIRRADNHQFKEQLRQRADVLQRVYDALGVPAQA